MSTHLGQLVNSVNGAKPKKSAYIKAVIERMGGPAPAKERVGYAKYIAHEAKKLWEADGHDSTKKFNPGEVYTILNEQIELKDEDALSIKIREAKEFFAIKKQFPANLTNHQIVERMRKVYTDPSMADRFVEVSRFLGEITELLVESGRVEYKLTENAV